MLIIYRSVYRFCASPYPTVVVGSSSSPNSEERAANNKTPSDHTRDINYQKKFVIPKLLLQNFTMSPKIKSIDKIQSYSRKLMESSATPVVCTNRGPFIQATCQTEGPLNIRRRRRRKAHIDKPAPQGGKQQNVCKQLSWVSATRGRSRIFVGIASSEWWKCCPANAIFNSACFIKTRRKSEFSRKTMLNCA